MSRLSDLQTAFVAGLLKPEAPPPAGVHGPTATLPVKRYNVYRNNLVASLIQVLEARYPVVLRLVGDEFFRGMARLYVEASTCRDRRCWANSAASLRRFSTASRRRRTCPILPMSRGSNGCSIWPTMPPMRCRSIPAISPRSRLQPFRDCA